MGIPTVIVEEHHEAFIAWNWAVRQGVIAEQGSILLHVDEHADFEAPYLSRPLHEVAGDPEAFANLVYNDIAIYEFIVAAVHQRMFTDVYWVRQGIKERQEQKLELFSERGEGLKLVMRPLVSPSDVPVSGLPASDRIEFRFIAQGTRPVIPDCNSMVLDIDLDFFSSDQAEHRVDRMEVTAEEFEKFQQDKYHFLRLDHGGKVTAHKKDGRYFFHFRDYSSTYACRSKVSWEAIDARLTLFDRMLERSNINPKLITIARSRRSGYTPADQWERIEELLVNRVLQKRFDLAHRSIDQTVIE